MHEIKDNVLKTEKVEWRKLEWLQNEKLKDFFVKSKDLLKESLKKNDYIDPLNVWQDETGKIWVLDGCHRQAALKECEEEGIKIPELLTANFIKRVCTAHPQPKRGWHPQPKRPLCRLTRLESAKKFVFFYAFAGY